MCRRRTLRSRPSAGRTVPSRWRTRWSPNSPTGIRHLGPGAHTSPGLRWRSCARWRRMRNLWCSVSVARAGTPKTAWVRDGRRSRPDVRAACGSGPQCPGGRGTARPRRRRDPRDRRPQPGPRRGCPRIRDDRAARRTAARRARLEGLPAQAAERPFPALEEDRATWEDDVVQRLSDALRPWRGKYPEVDVLEDVVLLTPALSLLPHTGCPVAVVPVQPCSGSQIRHRLEGTAAEDLRPPGWGPSAHMAHRGDGSL